jgi:hypothetical protein
MSIEFREFIRAPRWRRRLTLAALALAACGTAEDGGLGPGPAVLSGAIGQGRGRVILVRDLRDPQWPSDPVTITGVAIEGDTIRLGVSFGGGCRDHQLQLITDVAWMESYPVQVAARVAHEDNDDPCDALITGSLSFDLSPLKRAYQASYQSPTGKIALRLQGAPSVPVYTF